MTGIVAQLISLVSFGNDFLINGKLSVDYLQNNTTFQFCNLVDFRENKKTYFFSKTKEIVISNNPIDWFQYLKDHGCKKLRLYYKHSKEQASVKDHQLAGLVGGGGVWLIEAVYKDYSNYWLNSWAVTNQNARDRKIWSVNYTLVLSGIETSDIRIDLTEAKSRLSSTLIEIAGFAYSQKLDSWGSQFVKANKTFESPNPNENLYDKDLIVSANYSLISQQVLFSAGSAWVFGGMGSWNDLSFDKKEDNEKYDNLSAKLYDTIIEGIIAAVNSY
jgi:hypothetical protein